MIQDRTLEKLIIKKVPKRIIIRTRSNMNKYCMDFHDAFQEAVRTYAKPDTDLWRAFYFNDFREYIPTVYFPDYLGIKEPEGAWSRIKGIVRITTGDIFLTARRIDRYDIWFSADRKGHLIIDKEDLPRVLDIMSGIPIEYTVQED